MSNTLSVVIPVYKSEKHIIELNERLIIVLEKISEAYEIIYVNDDSPDGSWELIEQISNKNKKVKGLSFSRNFGQHYAITAGLEYAQYDNIVVMDCDLQDPPEEIFKLIKYRLDGYDIVLARREDRGDGSLKKLSSRIYYKILGYLTGTSQNKDVGNFGVYSRQVIQEILKMGDYYRYLPTMTQWVGFKKIEVQVEHNYRKHDKTSYTFSKLFKLGVDNIISFSDKPMILSIRLGIFVIIFAFVMGFYVLYKYYSGQITELGYSSLILSIWFLSGILILIIGVIGLYIAKSFETVKRRPKYIIRNTLNVD